MENNIKLKANIDTANSTKLLLCREVDGQFCWYVNMDDQEFILEDTYPVDSLAEAEAMLWTQYPRYVYNTQILRNLP